MPKMVPTFQYVGLFYSALSDNKRSSHVLVFLYYINAQKASTCIFCSEKIVLLKREVYCTMFTQTALFLLINKHYFENIVWSEASYLVYGYCIIAGEQKRCVSQEAGRRTELTEPGPTG
jgi:hypothetical protein